MAVFLINSCKFRGCDLVYETLPELIQHIEESHIGADGVVLECAEEGSLTSLPCASLALQYFGNLTPRKSILSVKKVRPRSTSVMSSSASIRSLTPTSSEYDYNDDDEHADSYNSSNMDCERNSSITPEQQFTSQLILRMMSNKTDDIQRPYVCPMQGCKKRYKNVNGVKYHARNGHKREAKLAQLTLKCFCGKSYRTARLLQQHTDSDHALQSYPLITHVDHNTHEHDMDMKIEPLENHRNITSVHSSSAPAGVNTSTNSIINTSKGVSVIHPLTLSGGVILTSSSNNRKNINHTSVSNSTIIGTASLVTSSTGELLLTRKLTNGSFGTGTAVMTPPTTPHKTSTTSSHITSRSQQATLEQEQQQRIINEKVAKALAEAKEAMNALHGARSANSNNTTTQIVHLVNNINNKSRSMSIVNNTDTTSTANRVTQLIPVTAPLHTVKPKIEVGRTSTASV